MGEATPVSVSVGAVWLETGAANPVVLLTGARRGIARARTGYER